VQGSQLEEDVGQSLGFILALPEAGEEENSSIAKKSSSFEDSFWIYVGHSTLQWSWRTWSARSVT